MADLEQLDLKRLEQLGKAITAMQKNQFRTGMRLVRNGIGHYVVIRPDQTVLPQPERVLPPKAKRRFAF